MARCEVFRNGEWLETNERFLQIGEEIRFNGGNPDFKLIVATQPEPCIGGSNYAVEVVTNNEELANILLQYALTDDERLTQILSNEVQEENE